MSDDNCLDAASPDGPVKLVRCHGMGGNQAWVYNDEVRKNNALSSYIFHFALPYALPFTSALPFHSFVPFSFQRSLFISVLPSQKRSLFAFLFISALSRRFCAPTSLLHLILKCLTLALPRICAPISFMGSLLTFAIPFHSCASSSLLPSFFTFALLFRFCAAFSFLRSFSASLLHLRLCAP